MSDITETGQGLDIWNRNKSKDTSMEGLQEIHFQASLRWGGVSEIEHLGGYRKERFRV